MADVLLPGIAATRVTTPRLTQNVLHPAGSEPGAGPGDAVLFVHGNVSSALFWQQPLLALAETGRVRPLAVDLRGYGDTGATSTTEATRSGWSSRYCRTTPPPMLQPTRCTRSRPSVSTRAATSSDQSRTPRVASIALFSWLSSAPIRFNP